MPTTDPDVIVLGAGLAGLAAAATAARAGRRVVVLAGSSPDGRAATDVIDGFSFNRGPHALYDGAGRAVLARLGIHPDGAPPPLRGGVLELPDGSSVALPRNLGGLLRSRLVGLRGKAAVARLLAGLKRLDPADAAGATAEDWLSDLPADAARLVRVLVRVATYSAATDLQSGDLAISQLQAGQSVRYLHGGWQQLTTALRAAAPFTVVPEAVLAVRSDGSSVEVDTAHGTHRAPAVVLAAGSAATAARLLDADVEAWSALGPPAEVACLNLGLRRVPTTPLRFGLDDPTYLVAHAPAARLAPLGRSLVHVARYLRPGDAPSPADGRADLEAIIARAGIEPGDVIVARYLHRMVAATALPTPANGGLAGRPTIDSSGVPGVWVAGDWVGPTGFLADASLASGEAAGAAAAHAPVRLAA